MASGQVDLVENYRRDARQLAWSGVIAGAVLIAFGLLFGLFFGLWLTVIGMMFEILAAVRLWTLDLAPDDVVADRVRQRRERHPLWYMR